MNFAMKNIIIYFIFIGAWIPVLAQTSREKWISDKWEIIRKSKEDPGIHNVEKLGRLIRSISRNEENSNLESLRLLKEARNVMYSTPGHAEYFQNRLNELYDEAVEEFDRMNGVRQYYDISYHERGWYLLTLKYIKSPESIRVLGEMLDDLRSNDPKNRPPLEWDIDGPMLMPYGWEAAQILTDLELSGAPMKQFIFPDREELQRMTAEDYYNMNIEPWRLWYAQVKAGTRTFRFKDDPQEYNLDGPVAVALVPSPASRKPAGTEEARDPGVGRFNPWPLTTSLLALAAAGGWYLRHRKGLA